MKAKVIGIIDLKTIKVISNTYKKHERYGKFITVSKKFIVDTNGKESIEIGQEVVISNSKPISKKKKWIIK